MWGKNYYDMPYILRRKRRYLEKGLETLLGGLLLEPSLLFGIEVASFLSSLNLFEHALEVKRSPEC